MLANRFQMPKDFRYNTQSLVRGACKGEEAVSRAEKLLGVGIPFADSVGRKRWRNHGKGPSGKMQLCSTPFIASVDLKPNLDIAGCCFPQGRIPFPKYGPSPGRGQAPPGQV